MAINNDCQTIAAATIKFAEIIDYPQNKLHGKVILRGMKGSSKDQQVGVMDYWFKLHTHDVTKIRSFIERRDNNERISAIPPVLDQNVSFLQGERKKLMRNKKIQEDMFTSQEDEMTVSQPSEESLNKIKTDLSIQQQSSINKEYVNKPKPKARKPAHLQNFPTKDRPKPPRLSKTNVFNSENLSTVSHPSLSKDCVSELNNIIKKREKSNKKKASDKNSDEKEVNKETENLLDSPKKRRSILKSLSGKPVKSEESALLTRDIEKNDDVKEEPLNNQIKSPKENSQIVKVVTMKEPEKDDQSKMKMETSETVESTATEQFNNGNDSVDDEESSEEESDEEDGTYTVDDSEDSEDETDEEDDDYDEMTTTEATTKADSSMATSTSEAKPAAKLIVTPEVHNDSHDSEGVVTKKSPVKKTSLANKDNIIILVSDFEAAKDASFIKDDKVCLLYVEYSFLDTPPEELETPFSLPKPASMEKITFNFRKVFIVDRADNSQRRRLVSKMLRSEDSEPRILRFKIVSEPPDSEPDLDCEDIGIAEIDLGIIDRSGQDLVDKKLDVMSYPDRSSCIGTLTVSIEAHMAFQSIKA